MRVLVACECSGIVRDAFRALGHDAWSCDLDPCEADDSRHLRCDVRILLVPGQKVLRWDLLIAHPPCTHLAVSGARYFEQKRKDGRQKEAVDFFMQFANAEVPRICIENPVSIISTLWRKPDQIIQPYQFGHPESKKTCLWLKNLPPLVPTKIMEPVWFKNPDGTDYKDSKGKRYSPTHYLMGMKQFARWANQTDSGQNKLGPSPDRAKIRSRTYRGIAEAMAKQWGCL
jgi:hypothetical protein